MHTTVFNLLSLETIHTNALASQGKKKQSDSFKELFCPFCEKNFKDKNEFSGHISKVMYGQCPTGAGYQKIETKNDTSQKTDNVVGESKDRKPKSFKEMLQNVKEKTSTGKNFSNRDLIHKKLDRIKI